MNFPSRRKPLALLFCCGFVSVLVGGYATEAEAQSPTPLRVDPALLGLPPLKPADASAPVTDGGRGDAAPEISPVHAPVVEAVVEPRPVVTAPPVSEPVSERTKAGKASAQEIPARTVAPQAAPAVISPTPVPAPADVAEPMLAPPARAPRAAERQAAPTDPATQAVKRPDPLPEVVTAPPQAPAPVASVPARAAPSAAALPSLRVDPALLGQTAAASAAAAAVAVTPARATATTAAAAAKPAPLVVASASAPGRIGKSAGADKSWFRSLWNPVDNAYTQGDWEFYLPFETYHSRSSYSAEQIAGYQEKPLGFGVGKGLYNEHGNWEGVYALAFQDSHFKPSYTGGYGWKAIWRPTDDIRVGLGYLAGVMARADVISYMPFPIVVPLASVSYKNLSIEGTYIPPAGTAGNVIFLWAKWELGKTGEAVGTPAAPPAPSEMMAGSGVGQLVPTLPARVPYGPLIDLTPGAVAGPGLTAAATTAAAPTAAAPIAWREPDEVPDTQPPLALRSTRTMVPLSKDSEVQRPVFISASRMGGEVNRELNAEGDAELRKIGTILNSDRLTYWPIDDEMEAEGNVRLDQGTDLITGPKMRLKLEEQVGFFDQPVYTIKRQPEAGSQAAADKAYAAESLAKLRGEKSWLNSGFASGLSSVVSSTELPTGMTEGRGDGDRLDFEGKNQFRLTNGTYTTCGPGNDDWYLKTSDLQLDYDREVADGLNGTVYFKGTPLFYSPWLSFSLNHERRSGFLPPSVGSSSGNGVELALPYYWNIAPNMDATITPQVLTKRGVLLNNEFRYLNTALGGVHESVVGVNVLPGDNLRDGDTRYLMSLAHNQTFANGFSGTINYTKVSDDNYFTDLSGNIASTSQVNLLQQATLSYGGGGWWSATANFQGYQTLQPDSSTVNAAPYSMMPQLTVNARKPDLFLTDMTFLGQYTDFRIGNRQESATASPDGKRTVLYPQVALPYVTPGWYVTPKVGVNVTNYALTDQAAGTPGSINRTLPIVSVDSGMTFERPSNWFGSDYTQTLEPRLYYLNVPYRNQDQIPIFDTGLADFNFAQIFSENQFSSWDRVSNANQLTAAVTTRLLEPATGNEIGRAMVGQRFYFEQNKVLLPSTVAATEKWDKSDWLAAFSGQILPKVYLDTALQYNVADRETKRFSVGTRYQPEPGKVLNLAYRFNRDTSAPIDQIDLSGQWPIVRGLYGVGRLNYSFGDDAANTSSTTSGGSLIEAIGGLEYNGGCWIIRGVARRTAVTATSSSTGFFIQLELSGFSRIGSNPLNLLKTNIQGYSLINQPTTDAVLGQ